MEQNRSSRIRGHDPKAPAGGPIAPMRPAGADEAQARPGAVVDGSINEVQPIVSAKPAPHEPE